ncbi:hypothetical protein E2562_029999 [Oryza meyeriana var. granulata]|uniref:Uncharacterized protein n=1 Tax=Oryza meyeriana var. granulata TaxID=110450 RepID=A0A6G1FDP6_9ORYZ|nr:hypothetical protein E2562_029999 [Oryza meyeriana var. granulata]
MRKMMAVAVTVPLQLSLLSHSFLPDLAKLEFLGAGSGSIKPGKKAGAHAQATSLTMISPPSANPSF